MTKNRKIWLIIKGLFILILSFSYYYFPPQETYRKNIRVGIIILFTISFLYDLYQFQKKR